MSMSHGALGTETTDDDFDDGDEDISSERPAPSGVITPSKSAVRSSDGALTATTVERRVVRVSDTSHATHRAMLYFLYTGLVPDSPTRLWRLTAFRLLLDSARSHPSLPLNVKQVGTSRTTQASLAVTSFQTPTELTFTHSQQDPTLTIIRPPPALWCYPLAPSFPQHR